LIAAAAAFRRNGRYIAPRRRRRGGPESIRPDTRYTPHGRTISRVHCSSSNNVNNIPPGHVAHTSHSSSSNRSPLRISHVIQPPSCAGVPVRTWNYYPSKRRRSAEECTRADGPFAPGSVVAPARKTVPRRHLIGGWCPVSARSNARPSTPTPPNNAAISS